MEAFVARTDLSELSPREYSDAYSEALRPSNIKMRDGFEKLGWLAPRQQRHGEMKAVFDEFGFTLTPKHGWPAVLDELDLIFVQFDVPDTSKGYAELLKDVKRCIGKLQKLRETFIEFNHSIDFQTASMLSQAATNENVSIVQQLIKSHEAVAQWLSENVQSPRWRDKTARNCRVELATKLMTLFYREFGLMPKPDGGSAHIPVTEANHWQKFFQACAFMRLGERETPDRQAILWEAHGNW